MRGKQPLRASVFEGTRFSSSNSRVTMPRAFLPDLFPFAEVGAPLHRKGDPMTSSQVTSSDDRGRWQTGAVAATVAVYGLTLGSMATIGVVVPQMQQLSSDLNASMADLGFAIGLYSLPAALFSIPLGAVIDRLGAKHALTIAALFALVADALIYSSGTLFSLQAGLAIAGIANAIIITAAPALLMTVLTGTQQVRAMALWSTYGPAGYALGLLIGAPFAGSADWRFAIICPMGLIAAAIVGAIVVLPNPGRAASGGSRVSLRQMLALFCDVTLLRISLAYALVAGLSYGSSLAAPGFLAKVYGVSMASSATAIAAAKIVAMLLGGVGMGWLLAGKHGRQAMFLFVCAFGLLAQFVLYFPGSGMLLATSAMIVWLFAYGAISATSFVALAEVNRDPARAGLAAGVIGQIGSLACVAAPSIYFAVEHWLSFVVIAAVGLALAALLFPHRYGRPPIA